MEHLTTPDGAQPIHVPYVGTVEYDGGNFKGYFERQGWERQKTGQLIFGNRPPDQVASFLQTWLYFGCLISVFECGGVAVLTKDFIRVCENGDRVVCTQRLPEFILDWDQHVRRYPDNLKGQNVIEYLNYTYWYLMMFSEESDLLSLIKMSIMSIGESLSTACNKIYGFNLPVPRRGPSLILRDRLRRAGWCPSDTPFFPESQVDSNICADYYFGSYNSPRKHADHSRCTEVACKASQDVVDSENYHAMHVTSNCLCRFVEAPPDTVALVAGGKIPAMHWDGKSLSVFPQEQVNGYVAISHV